MKRTTSTPSRAESRTRACGALACCLVALLGACDRPKPGASSVTASPSSAAAQTPSATAAPSNAAGSPKGAGTSMGAGTLGMTKPAPERIVAVGDLHGDLDAARRAFRLAGAIDAKDAWIGGALVLVQTGDAIDRGDDDRKILDLIEHLKSEAPKSGGEVVALVGNHEIMNSQLDFRYVTRGAFSEFSDVSPKSEKIAQAASHVESPAERGRASAFLPGGPYAQMLARRPVVARVGDSIFVHGGVLPKHVRSGLDAINEGTRDWLLGERASLPKEITAEDGPLWTRIYSAAPGREECATLREALDALGAKRMIMGHTPQKPDISPACEEKAWRIDTGMAKYYAGQIEVLELRGDALKILKEAR